jgi:anti-sigma regulatory factor (Ser/Thr protein kinase)
MTTISTKVFATGAPGYSETLPCKPESAALARRLVNVAVHTWGIGELADAAVLIVSELVANSVEHSRCRLVRVAVERPTPTRIKIIVADKNRLVPILRHALPDAENGRGLLVIDALSARWGYDRPHWGKRVWAELEAAP